MSSTNYLEPSFPGCKTPFLELERMALERWHMAAFALLPLHIANIVAGLLCSNREGDEAYRLSRGDGGHYGAVCGVSPRVFLAPE
ncbi:hypothetical protein FB451DRAFT_1295933 [Mycena latifolia]|nr:hypothetical protein FB451DRAFT_1295933 [Mycena latifolia]